MEEDFEISIENSDEDNGIHQYAEKEFQERKGNKKGNFAKSEGTPQRSNPTQKSRKPKRKLKTVAHLSAVGVKTKNKKTKDKKIIAKGSKKTFWDEQSIRGEDSSWEDLGMKGQRRYNVLIGIGKNHQKLNGNPHRVKRSFKTTSHAIDWAVNPRRRTGELKPLKQTKKKAKGKQPAVTNKQNKAHFTMTFMAGPIMMM